MTDLDLPPTWSMALPPSWVSLPPDDLDLDVFHADLLAAAGQAADPAAVAAAVDELLLIARRYRLLAVSAGATTYTAADHGAVVDLTILHVVAVDPDPAFHPPAELVVHRRATTIGGADADHLVDVLVRGDQRLLRSHHVVGLPTGGHAHLVGLTPDLAHAVPVMTLLDAVARTFEAGAA